MSGDSYAHSESCGRCHRSPCACPDRDAYAVVHGWPCKCGRYRNHPNCPTYTKQGMHTRHCCPPPPCPGCGNVTCPAFGDECWWANGCPSEPPEPKVIAERPPGEANGYEQRRWIFPWERESETRNMPSVNPTNDACRIINQRLANLMRQDLKAATAMHSVQPSAAWSCVVVKWEGTNKATMQLRIDPRFGADLDEVLAEFLDQCQKAQPCDCRYGSHGDTCVKCGKGAY